MTNGKLHFGIGLVAGVLISALFFMYFAPRYTTVKLADTLIKQDRWSGDSWRFDDDQWKKIMNVSREWEIIDDTLMEALHMPTDGAERIQALTLLRKKDLVLGDLSDDELLERIKLVYSKEILVNMYLRNFLKLEQVSQSKEKEAHP
ncbi:hypothetical protein ACFL9U_15835 [Thermodesulfobacteriota bacterium]